MRMLSVPPQSGAAEGGDTGQCILWIDGSEGVVRAMDLVADDSGMEAVVRTLLRAMEYPHGGGRPLRPRKIVVRDRELLFFLRGALQELNIELDYAAELPLIDDLFRTIDSSMRERPPHLPPAYVEPLYDRAHLLWNDAPWDYLADHQTVRIDLNAWGLESLYVSVLGMLGLDYGILFYRSLDSLKSFRAAAVQNESMENLEQVFLSQDCFFLTYDSEEVQDSPDEMDLAELPWSDIDANFGSLHPLEGLRPFLHEEEALPVYVALEALHRFFSRHGDTLAIAPHRQPTGSYRIAIPKSLQASAGESRKIPVTVTFLADLSEELLSMAGSVPTPDEDEVELGMDMLSELLPQLETFSVPPLYDDLIPDGSVITLAGIPWGMLQQMRDSIAAYTVSEGHTTPSEPNDTEERFPAILVQTTRPKVKQVLEAIEEEGGLQGLLFEVIHNAVFDESVEVGALRMGNGQLQLFGEFDPEEPTHKRARQLWDNRANVYHSCALVLAMGATGQRRGQADLRDMMALFEVPYLTLKDLCGKATRRSPKR